MPFNPLLQISGEKRVRSTSYGRFIVLFALIILGTLVALAAQYRLSPGKLNPFIWIPWIVFSISIGLGPFLYWYLQPTRATTPQKDVIDLFIKIASSVLVIAGLAVTWLSFSYEQQKSQQTLELGQTQLANTRSEQRSQRFVKALEGLGSQNTFQRLAGVYAFKQLDETFMSKEKFNEEYSKLQAAGEMQKADALRQEWNYDTGQHWTIMETLTHFIQEKTPIPDPPRKLEERPKALVEVYEILKYLGSRKLVYDFGEYDERVAPTKRLNLINVDLRGYSFHSGHFQGTNFKKAHLEGADFRCTNLRNAIFFEAILTNADLRGADLSYADFFGANLSGADLTGARISEDKQLGPVTFDNETKCPDGSTYDPLRACVNNVNKKPDSESTIECLKKYLKKDRT